MHNKHSVFFILISLSFTETHSISCSPTTPSIRVLSSLSASLLSLSASRGNHLSWAGCFIGAPVHSPSPRPKFKSLQALLLRQPAALLYPTVPFLFYSKDAATRTLLLCSALYKKTSPVPLDRRLILHHSFPPCRYTLYLSDKPGIVL